MARRERTAFSSRARWPVIPTRINPAAGKPKHRRFRVPYNPAYSMLTQLAPGDYIRNLAALQAGGTVPYETLQIVQVTSLGSNLWQFVASRVAASGKNLRSQLSQTRKHG